MDYGGVPFTSHSTKIISGSRIPLLITREPPEDGAISLPFAE